MSKVSLNDVIDVYSEFRKYIGEGRDKIELIVKVLVDIENKRIGESKLSYRDRMFNVRQVLKDEYSYSIPFKSYRKVK